MKDEASIFRPGVIVALRVTFSTKIPLAVAGRALTTASMTAAPFSTSACASNENLPTGTAQLPLPGALLRVGSLSQAADDEGFAVFAGVPGPSVTVEVSQVGFETQSRNVTVRQGVQGNDESFYLEMEGAPEEGEGEPEPPGGCPCNGEKQGPPQGGELVLSAMVLIALLAGSMSKREH